MKSKKRILLVLFYFLMFLISRAQTEQQMDWWFWPDYTLDRNAKNQIGPRIPIPNTPISPVTSKTDPFLFFGQDPTERIVDFTPAKAISTNQFSVEMWMLYHVNQEVGCFTTYRNKYESTDPVWLIGLYGKELVFSLKHKESTFSSMISHTLNRKGWKNYWLHLVGTYDGSSMKLFLNGELVNETEVGDLVDLDVSEMMIETSGYLSNEPYMNIGDLLKNLRIYDYPLSIDNVRSNQKNYRDLVVEGKLYPELFHYTAGPYLQMVTPQSIGMVIETSDPATHTLTYWKADGAKQTLELNNATLNREIKGEGGEYITKLTLSDLEAGQPYFYEIVSRSSDGEKIATGRLTFKTAEVDPAGFTFSVIGDTEARPHVNDRVSKLLWDERPEFLLNLGDLTDGGKEDHKFQWNHEYFYGLNQLTSRIPIFPVAGNGEGDLYWFNKYHILPNENKGYYTFSYGDADFFMLDSNQKEGFSKGGEQYKWLENELKESTATWKFVAHHHAPYSSDENDYGDTWKEKGSLGDPKIKKIVPLYEKYGVDVVFFGHLHTYQRTHQIQNEEVSTENGVMYIQAGGAGGNLEDFAPTRSWFSAKTFRGHHYLTVEVLQNQLELRMYDSEGRMKDIFRLNKTH